MKKKGEKKQFNTNINEEVLEEFKKFCKEKGVNVNGVLEQFMLDVLSGRIQIHSKIELKQD